MNLAIMTRHLSLVVLACLCVWPVAEAASFNKCKDPAGRVSYSEVPCKATDTLQEKVVTKKAPNQISPEETNKRLAAQKQLESDANKRLKEQDSEHETRKKKMSKDAESQKKKCAGYREQVEQYNARMRAGASANTYNGYAARKQELEEKIRTGC